MHEELEICVRSFDNYEEIMNKLDGFVIKEDFQLNDIYMISKDIDEMINSLNKYNLSIGDFYFENKSINCLRKIKNMSIYN